MMPRLNLPRNVDHAWNMWSCGHPTDVGNEAAQVVEGRQGPETRCETCDARVGRGLFPCVRVGGSDSISPDRVGGGPTTAHLPGPRPMPLLPAASVGLLAFEEGATSDYHTALNKFLYREAAAACFHRARLGTRRTQRPADASTRDAAQNATHTSRAH